MRSCFQLSKTCINIIVHMLQWHSCFGTPTKYHLKATPPHFHTKLSPGQVLQVGMVQPVFIGHYYRLHVWIVFRIPFCNTIAHFGPLDIGSSLESPQEKCAIPSSRRDEGGVVDEEDAVPYGTCVTSVLTEVLATSNATKLESLPIRALRGAPTTLPFGEASLC